MWTRCEVDLVCSCKQVGIMNTFSASSCCYLVPEDWYLKRSFLLLHCICEQWVKKYWARRRIAMHTTGYLCFSAYDGSVPWFCSLTLHSFPQIDTHLAPGCVHFEVLEILLDGYAHPTFIPRKIFFNWNFREWKEADYHTNPQTHKHTHTYTQILSACLSYITWCPLDIYA